MRILALIISLYYLSTFISNAQNNDELLNKRVRFPKEKLTVQCVLNELTKKYNINFSYEPTEIPLQKNVAISKSEITLREALNGLAVNSGIEYIVRSKVIIIRKSDSNKSVDPNLKKEKYTISGLIKDSASAETLPYTNVCVMGMSIGTVSNQYGFYSITLPKGEYQLVFKCVGFEEMSKDLNLEKDIRLDVDLLSKSQELQEVIITNKTNNLRDIERRMSKIDVKTIKEMPALGESDILRGMQFLPSVSSGAEVGGGMVVRGGAWDQNLMLLDEATVYNANHLIGIYSTFNPDIIKDIKFYTSGIPASYGGRTSSVMDVTQKEGNMKSYHCNLGIGLITSKLTFEGPLLKDKSSFVIAARRSYVDLFFKYIPNDNVKDVKTYFYDINSKINLIINDNNRIFLSCYVGKDLTNVSDYNEDYGNITGTLRFNHIFSKKLFSNTSIIYSKYNMTNVGESVLWGWKNTVGLAHYEFKNAFNYYTAKHNIEFGIKSIYYKFCPGDLKPVGDSSQTFTMKIPEEYALESALYLSDNFRIGAKLEIQMGLRFSTYNFLGKADIYSYGENTPKHPSTITDTIHYNKNAIIKSYYYPEPRLSIKYNFSDHHSIKLSYNKMAQYIQQISNQNIPLPNDMWKASNSNIKPLTGQQFSVGYFSVWKEPSIEFSCEVYYKLLENVLEVKPGTDIYLNETIDAGLLQGKGRARGIELMASKTEGKLTGTLSYTWSKTERKIDSKFLEETINFGNYYPANYDIPNKLTLTAEYKISKRFSFTSDFTYQTGRPITLPSGQYTYFYTLMPYYSGKNLQRMPNFHRLDIGAVLKNKYKENRKWESFWTFSLYNVYGRKNAFSLYLRRKPNTKNTEAVKMWFMSVVPSLSYSIKF
jgi:hypothetical protein